MEELLSWYQKNHYIIVFVLVFCVSVVTAIHVVINKRDPRSAYNWILTSLLLPGIGPLVYWIAGVNRIQTRAAGWAEKGHWGDDKTFSGRHLDNLELSNPLPIEWAVYAPLVKVSSRMSRRPLLGDHQIYYYNNGEEAYPSMIEAINKAQKFVYFSTYIFDKDDVGLMFANACAQAVARGVDVRILVDGVGRLYSFPSIVKTLKKSGVKMGIFLDPLSSKGLRFNLRNHRKILVIDGCFGFTGGMNISSRHLKSSLTKSPVSDMHFQFIGPVVTHLEETFLADWFFVTQEVTPVRGDAWNHDDSRGSWCRGISAGPNNEMERLYWVILGALSVARKKIRIMTPYFIPDRALLASLCAAALRGVEVNLILPEKNNIPLIHWAARAYLHELVAAGVRVFYQPPPFNHSKLLLVDDVYSLVGSLNLDSRSLRLNFEFCVEIYDSQFTTQLNQQFDQVKNISTEVTPVWLKELPVVTRVIDGLSKLFSPYL